MWSKMKAAVSCCPAAAATRSSQNWPGALRLIWVEEALSKAAARLRALDAVIGGVESL